MKNHEEETTEELDEQTKSTIESLEGTAHEQASTSSDNPLFRPGNDNNSD